MINEQFIVCSIGLSGEATPNRFSIGRLVYVYHITDENYQQTLMKFIDDSILESVHEKYPKASVNREDYTNKEQVKKVWEATAQKDSEILWVLPTAEYENVQDAGYRSLNGEKIPAMPAFPVSLYMDISGVPDDKFFPFNTIELRYPLTLKREEAKGVEAFSQFVKSAVKRLEEIIGDK